jgi:hypothetical protein
MVTPTISAEQIRTLTKKLAPVKTQHSLVRMGPPHDGGYLIPDDLNGIGACFSPGVFTYAHFEEDLLRRYAINSHQADYSVDGPPKGFQPLSFRKKFIGAYNDNVYMTMEKWMKDSWEYDLGSDFILQMDIEGGEYDAILSTPDKLLKRFRIIVLEIHYIDKWGLSEFYSIANAMLEKLKQHFYVVHLHPNNCGGMLNVNGVELPCVLEVTLHRKDRCVVSEGTPEIPHVLDSPCGPGFPDLELPNAFR